MDRINVGILIFPGVEVLDFAGPFEVFSRTRTVPGTDSRRTDEAAPFRVFTISPDPGPLQATGGLTVTADYSYSDFDPPDLDSQAGADSPRIDLLLVPGGFGTRALLNDSATLDWVRVRSGEARWTASVCTGALVLAQAGLLAGRTATTHWASLDLLGELDPTITVEREGRVVRDGVISSAGVAAGIDMAFELVADLCGAEVARETAHYIEYRWEPGGEP